MTRRDPTAAPRGQAPQERASQERTRRKLSSREQPSKERLREERSSQDGSSKDRDSLDRPIGLIILGLTPGEQVRFRRSPSSRWQEARVTRRERDGSVGLTDRRGAARALPVEMIEVRCVGPRGGVAWEPLTARASRTEQLRLL